MLIRVFDDLVGLLVDVAKLNRVGVLRSGLAAEANVGVQGEYCPYDLESCLGVWKEFKKKFGDVGVLVGVGSSPLG